jgi:hypothetical protein
LALTKLVGVSKQLFLLDAPSSSHGHHSRGAKAGEGATRVATFNNLGDDSSPDDHEAALP